MTSALTRFGAMGLLALCFASAGMAAPSNQSGRVIYVDDGDTLAVLIEGNRQLKIRLSSIDAPEVSHSNKERGRVGQPYSENSKRYLSSLVKGKVVDSECYELDRYGRAVCEIFVDGQSVNRAMVAQGFAWANLSSHGRYLRDKSLPALEATARMNRAGLWAGHSPVAPWEWRDVCWKQGACGQ